MSSAFCAARSAVTTCIRPFRAAERAGHPTCDRKPSAAGAPCSRTPINRQPFLASLPPPYVIAIVELVEQVGLQFTTNIVECDPDDVVIGMPVRVVFEQHGEIWLPKFVPEAAA